MPKREFNLSDLNGVNGFTINGAATGDNSGNDVAFARDMNADGIDDFLVGAYKEAGGRAYLLFGRRAAWPATLNLATINSSVGVRINGFAGRTGIVSSAGDVNGDGSNDLIIGTTRASQAYLVFGHNGTWPNSIDLAALNGTTGVIMTGTVNAGHSVSSICDANGDAYCDLVIGSAQRHGNYAGQSYLVFGHANPWPARLNLLSLNGSTGTVFHGASRDNLGYASSGAGDVNADGFGDVIIGALGVDSTGRAYLVFGHNSSWPASLSVSSLNGSTGTSMNGVSGHESTGQTVASAGDINGDGITDIIVGAPWASPGGRSVAGKNYLIFGHNGPWPARLDLASLNGTNGVIINGILSGDHSGLGVSGAGDVNGDGIGDIVIGAEWASPGGRSRAGQNYVVFGRTGAWPRELELSSLNGTTGVILNGVAAGGWCGQSVSAAGDINADGVDDVIIGAFRALGGAGQSYVIFGGAEQFSANQIEIQSGQMIRLNQTNLAVGPIIGNRTFTVTNTSHINFVSTYNTSQPLSNFTQQQINNGEILVIHDGSREAPSYTVSAEGITRVFSDVNPQQGNVSFSIGTPRVSAPHHEFNLSDLNGVNGFTINGIAAGDRSGHSVASAGDVNGDGINDLIIAAVYADPKGQEYAGQSYLVFGRLSAWQRTIELSTLNGTTGVIIDGIAPNDYSGVSVASAGDVNHDGISDIIIGANQANSNGLTNTGQSYLVFGHRGNWSAYLDLASLNGTTGVIINGIQYNDHSGLSVTSVGDMNGDEIDDVLIGARVASPVGRYRAGQSYLLFGRSAHWPSVFNLSAINGTNGVIINGIASGDGSGVVRSAGDINGDGLNDILIGAYQADPDARVDAGQSYVIFGHEGTWPTIFELSSLNGTTGVKINGIAAGDKSGISIAATGDVNGDDIDDVIIGADRINPGGLARIDQCYLVFGHNDSWPAVLELSSLDGITGVIISGEEVASNNSGFSVSGAGDLNHDGINDIIMGLYLADPGGRTNAGESYVLFGRREVWPLNLYLSSLNNRVGVVIDGIRSDDQTGGGTIAGDIDGDGCSDVIIGGNAADPGGRVDAGQSYIIFGGAEQFSSNEILIRQNETLTLSASNIEIAPNIDSRLINVTDVEHGYFALVSNQSGAINSFNQSQINIGDIVFIHDGGLQAPSYNVSAEGITRAFSNVHPQAANVSFVMSDAPTSAPTIMPTAIPTIAPIAMPTIAPTTVPTVAPSALPTSLPTVAPIAVPTLAPTTVLSLNPTSFFGVPTDVPTMAPVSIPTSAPTIAPFSISPTALINGVETAVTNDGGGNSDSGALVGGIAGGLVAVVALLLVGFFCYRRRQNEERKKLVQGVTGDEMRTVAMTLNPAFMAGANAPDAIASGEGVGDDPAAQYESPRLASRGTGGSVLDEEHYVAQTGGTVIITGTGGATYAVPMATDDGAAGIPAVDNQYRVFRSVEAMDVGAEESSAMGTTADTYNVFRSVGSSQS